MIIHVDMSGKLGRGKAIGIAALDVIGEWQCGIHLTPKFVKLLQKRAPNSQIYAICIAHLVIDDIAVISKIIICNDEPFSDVIKHLRLIFRNKTEFEQVILLSIGDLRKELHNKKVFSAADGLANAYRKRGNKIQRQNVGLKLNIKSISLQDFENYRKKCE